MSDTTKTNTTKTSENKLVKDDPACENAFRQAMKDSYGQPYLFDYQLEMTVQDAWNEIHAMQHRND